MSCGSYILFRSTKIHLFSLVVLEMSQAIAWLCQIVEYQDLFSISTKIIVDILLLCFALPGFEVPGNMFFEGCVFWNLCCFTAVKEQVFTIRHHQVCTGSSCEEIYKENVYIDL